MIKIHVSRETDVVPFSSCRPLHLAARLTEHPNIVDELLDKGAELNATNSTGATPLIAACQANNVFSASRLLSKGTHVSFKYTAKSNVVSKGDPKHSLCLHLTNSFANDFKYLSQ